MLALFVIILNVKEYIKNFLLYYKEQDEKILVYGMVV